MGYFNQNDRVKLTQDYSSTGNPDVFRGIVALVDPAGSLFVVWDDAKLQHGLASPGQDQFEPSGGFRAGQRLKKPQVSLGTKKILKFSGVWA